MSQVLKTKWGTAKIGNRGYYVITSSKEGNHMKYLHRLIWEDFYGKPSPKGCDIHHLNGIKTDNRIQNLQCVEHSAHLRFHNQGTNHPMYNKHRSEKTKIKISEAKNTIGYLNVTKHKDKRCEQGFLWMYRYTDEGKRKSINSVDLKKLEQKVKEQGLPWQKIGDVNHFAVCKWCGKEYQKQYNNQACCSKECQDKLTAENSCKSSMKHYYKHKVGNTNKKTITTLGSKGTSSTSKPKESFEEEHEWAMKEAKRIGFNIKKFNGPLAA